MTRQILPTDAELAGLDSLGRVREWTGLDDAVWQVASAAFGQIPSMRVLAMTPADSVLGVIRGLQLALYDTSGQPMLGSDGQPQARSLTMVESLQLSLMWRVCRQAYELPDVDLFAPEPLPSISASPLVTTPGSVGGKVANGVRKVKVSQIADQLDDTELEMIGPELLDEAFRTYRQRMGAEPMKESEPSPEQITVLHHRVIAQGLAPYADFSVLTPFGRRTQRAMKAKGFMLQEDGSWKQLEVPGPPTYEAWNACWEIFKSTLLMLQYKKTLPTDEPKYVISWAALEEYHARILRLVRTYPECWHLIMAAEDRCRGEHLERTRRLLVRAALEGRLPMNLPFDQNQPWIGTFMHCARDMDFWNNEVVMPAQNFLARGGAGKRMAREVAEDADLTPSAKEAIDNKTKGNARPFGQGESKSAKQRRRLKDRLDAAEKDRGSAAESNRSSSGKGGKGGKSGMQHPRKYGAFFVTTKEGVQICYSFAKGQMGSCSEPCPAQRAHVCQVCLGPHPNSQCSKTGKDGGKGSNVSK